VDPAGTARTCSCTCSGGAGHRFARRQARPSRFRLHFGLGKETAADLEIRWPLGRKETLRGIEANQLIVVREGEGIVRRERF
jgi:hypothetical protein